MTLSSLADFGLTSVIYPDNIGTVTADSANRVSAIADTLGLIADYTQGTDANKPLLTRSDNKENFLTNSEDLSNAAWVKTAVTISTDAINSPTGTLTADKLVETSATSTHEIYHSQTAIAGITYVFSCYAKAGERQYLHIYGTSAQFGTQDFATYDLSAGVITEQGSSGTASISDVGDGWYLCTRTLTVSGSTSTTARFFVSIATSPTGGRAPSYTGDITRGLYVWGCQSRTSLSDSTYLATTTAPQYRGVNGRRALRFNGGQVLNSTSILSSIFTASSKLIYVVFRTNIITLQQYLFHNEGTYFAFGVSSASKILGLNFDGTTDSISTADSITANNVVIARCRQDAGNLYVSFDTGAGFGAEASTASGNTTLLTSVIRIGATGSLASPTYGDIVAIATANTGATKPNLERLLREEFFGKSSLRINLLTGGLRVGNTTSYI
jgi:hypothetical protein